MKKILSLFTALLFAGSMMVVQAVDYYYRGNQNGWGATLMTASTDGYYAYISAKSYANNGNANNEFKIALSANGWDYNCSIASPGFNGTDITNMNNSNNSWNVGNSNNAIYHSSDYYVLVYFPNTTINTSNSPKMCASTTLPDNTPTPDVYTVVGEVPGLNWNQESSDHDMTENAGVFTLTLTDVELAVGNYNFKIVKNHSWDVSYPQDGNDQLSIVTAGIYDLTFTLDLSASPVQSVTPTLKQAIVVIPAIKMSGTFAGGSGWAETAEFTLAGNEETASLTLSDLPAGNYEFKVIVGSAWRGNGYNYHRDYTGAANIGEGDNMTLQADVTGDYTFTWTYETNALNITFPDIPEPDAFVAGSATEIFGSPAWDPAIAANKMTWDGELGKFKKVYTVDKAYKSVGLKVVYDNQWYGVEGGEDNVKFSLSGAGEFTVLFDKTTHYVTLDGAIVGEEQFDFAYAAVAANGEGNWAHGENWNEATTTNRMTEVAPNIWEISFDNVPAKECQLKFCFDGTWDHEFGGTFEAFGTESAAVYGNTSSSINFTSVAGSIITIRLDLSNFNFATKLGATFTVSQVEPAPPVPGFETVRDGLTAGNYYTLCYEKTMTAIQGASLWSFAGKDANMAYIVEAEAPYLAGTPYLIYAESEALEAMTETVGNPVAGNNNGLYGTFSYLNAAALNAAGATHMLKNNEIRPLGNNNHLDENRAYIILSEIGEQAPAPGRRVRALPMQSNVVTGIDNGEWANGEGAKVQKIFIDGQIYILRGEKMYDATGRLVK